MNANAAMELVILSGPQSGAHVQFDEQGTLSLGDDINNDIILRDASISGNQLKLLWLEGKIVLEILSGTARTAEAILETGHQIFLQTYTPVQIGDTVFAIGLSGNKKWAKVPTTVPTEYAATYAEDEIEAIAHTHNQETGNTPLKVLRLFYSGCVLMVLLAITAIYFQPQQVEGSLIPERPASEIKLEKLSVFLQDHAFSELELNTNADNAILLTGYVEKISDRNKLDDFTFDLGLVVENNIAVGENLITQVRDVFRLNKIEADVKLLSRGAIQVNTVENDLEALKKAELLAYRDLPLLKTLTVANQNTELEVEKKKVTAEKIKKETLDPTKIVMITPGPPGYLVTANRSKFYIGSKLPSGHKISRITIDKVYLTKAGEKIIVKF